MTKLQVCLVTVAAFVAVASAFPYKAEPVCSPTDEGSYYPHPDCTKYYVCSVGNLIIAECGTGTVWNPEIEQCDFPYNVPECVGGTRPPEDGSTTPRPTTTTAEPTTSSAASSTTTEATTTEATSTTQGSTTPLPNGCPPVGVDKIPYPGSCVLYFICLDGEPHVTNCSEGLYFNPETKDCDQPQNVDCTEPTTTQATTTTTRTTTRPTTTTTTRPSTTTTRSSTTTTRPSTTTTRPSTTTTRSSTTTTRPSTTTSRSTSTTTPAPTTANPEYECPEGVPFIYQPHPTDCTKFYSCENGTFQRVYACGSDFWFRFASQSCVQPWGDTCAQL
ncbi:hypothetical protein Ocin01_05920 [Orchesella cincta]|uniref:Chitin-binding type-2 domain-containing protein n=1 Tax=Orchesella cincta TaxID=48709 RepID=A0A1D2N6A1_ORCCI|nr:hypothetical protein Ocin01_05920 [Orchesella cincta]